MPFKLFMSLCLTLCIPLCLSACKNSPQINSLESEQMYENTSVLKESQQEELISEQEIDTTAFLPTRELVLATRTAVVAGMNDDEISRITENIKVANLTLERAYMYDNLFKKLADSKHLYWNYIDQKGDIQVGWELGEDMDYDASSGLSREEFKEKYGEPIMEYNRFDADNFIILMTEMRDSLQTDLLKEDFDNLIQDMQLAKDTHDVKYIESIYHTLHDMDYFLFRYGIDDVGMYVDDISTINRYYGTLSVY